MKTYPYWPLLLGLAACGTKNSHHDDSSPPVVTTPETRGENVKPETPGQRSPEVPKDMALASCQGSEKNSSWAFVLNTTKATDCSTALAQWGQLTDLNISTLSPDQVKALPPLKQPANIVWQLKSLTNENLDALSSFAPMASLDLSGASFTTCTHLENVPAAQIIMSQTSMAACDLKVNAATHSVILGANPDLKSLTLSNVSHLESLVLRQSSLSTLTIENAPNLRDLQIINSVSLKEMTLDSLPLLDILILNHNAQLSQLTLKNLPVLRQLDARENALQKITFAQTPKLAVLQVGRNRLTSPADLVGDISSASILNAKDNKLSASSICSLKPRVGKTTRVLLAPKELATFYAANCP